MSRRLLVLLVAAALAAAGNAPVLTLARFGGVAGVGEVARVAGSSIWHVSRSPKLRVDVATGCPRSLRTDQDVVNTFPGPPLVPPNPTGGLICRYHGLPSAGALGRQTRLNAAEAKPLAQVVRKLDLKPPPELVSCPMDSRSFAVVGFSYHGRPDVGLWYWTSGCQSLDNGRIGAAEIANPSFYTGFEDAINKLSPPLAA
jgi:hypothetical protein